MIVTPGRRVRRQIRENNADIPNDHWMMSISIRVPTNIGEKLLEDAAAIGFRLLNSQRPGYIRLGLPSVSIGQRSPLSPQRYFIGASRAFIASLTAVGISSEFLSTHLGELEVHISLIPERGSARLTLPAEFVRDWANLSADVYVDVVG
jgi:hypothetical protein